MVSGGVGGIREPSGVYGVLGGIGVAGGLGGQPHWIPVQGHNTHWHGCRGHEGSIRGCRSIRGLAGGLEVSGGMGWQVDWEPDHIGPQSRVPALPLVPLGEWPTSPRPAKGPYWGSHHSHWLNLRSDLPDQGWSSDRNELCRLLYTFGTAFSDSLHIIYTAKSHILTCNVKKCYMDYHLSWPIYAYPYTINLMYYNTMVLLAQN